MKYVVQWRMDNLSLALLAKRPLAVVLAQGFEDGVKLAVDCSAWDFWSVPRIWVSKRGNGQSVLCVSGSDCEVCSCRCISDHRACCSFRDAHVFRMALWWFGLVLATYLSQCLISHSLVLLCFQSVLTCPGWQQEQCRLLLWLSSWSYQRRRLIYCSGALAMCESKCFHAASWSQPNRGCVCSM